MTAKIEPIPVRADSPMARWIRTGRKIFKEVNETAARVWVIRHVPEQFREFVFKAVTHD